ELAETLVQLLERPAGEFLRVDGLRNLPNLAHDLRVAGQRVDELGVCRSEQPLTDRPEARLGRWACLFYALVSAQECLEIHAAELRSAVYDDGAGQPRIAPHGLSQH